jgi:hypothetical protein
MRDRGHWPFVPDVTGSSVVCVENGCFRRQP